MSSAITSDASRSGASGRGMSETVGGNIPPLYQTAAPDAAQVAHRGSRLDGANQQDSTWANFAATQRYRAVGHTESQRAEPNQRHEPVLRFNVPKHAYRDRYGGHLAIRSRLWHMEGISEAFDLVDQRPYGF